MTQKRHSRQMYEHDRHRLTQLERNAMTMQRQVTPFIAVGVERVSWDEGEQMRTGTHRTMRMLYPYLEWITATWLRLKRAQLQFL